MPFLLLQRRLDAAGANGAPTDPCFKGAEQSDEDKDRCEQPCLRNETTTGKEENDCTPATGNAAVAVDVLFHLERSRYWIARNRLPMSRLRANGARSKF